LEPSAKPLKQDCFLTAQNTNTEILIQYLMDGDLSRLYQYQKSSIVGCFAAALRPDQFQTITLQSTV